jgi:hypothetical protein
MMRAAIVGALRSVFQEGSLGSYLAKETKGNFVGEEEGQGGDLEDYLKHVLEDGYPKVVDSLRDPPQEPPHGPLEVR